MNERNERIEDLNCRQRCPYARIRNHYSRRPCLDEVKSGELGCINNIKNYFSKDNPNAVEIRIPENGIPHFPSNKMVVVNPAGKEIGRIANGTAITYGSGYQAEFIEALASMG